MSLLDNSKYADFLLPPEEIEVISLKKHNVLHAKKNSQVEHLPKLLTPCTFYAEGKCSKGVDCEFRHVGVKVNAKMDIPCQFFLQGICNKGDQCGFSHDLSQCPCKFYHLYGNCKDANCRWMHGEITPEQLASLKQQHSSEQPSTSYKLDKVEEKMNEQKPENQHGEAFSGEVSFVEENGMVVIE